MAEPSPPSLDNRVRLRLQRAGDRFRAAQLERHEAASELHGAMQEVDGMCTAELASELTGLPSELLQTLQPELRDS